MSSWILCSIENTTSTLNDFLYGINVWIEKPHVINRRLSGSNLIWKSTLNVDLNNVNIEDLKINLRNQHEKNEDSYIEMLTNYFKDSKYTQNDDNNILEIQLRQLIPKQIDRHSSVFLVTFKDETNGCFIEFPIDTENYLISQYPFKLNIELNEPKKLSLLILNDHQSEELLLQQSSVVWLNSVLFPRIKKWCEDEPIKNSIPSLKYVTLNDYVTLYSKLKLKYGPDIEKKWTEKTDPKKYVYEDIAIAAYLLIIWENERKSKNLKLKQSFIDFGCGNGLLVYLLTKEGHRGLGLDVRKRKIWDIYGPDVELKIEALNPSLNASYPNYDWFIGNHSDELTPWLPVMAAKSSYNTNFFLLPCCFHDFNGKFQRITSTKCQYESYLDYVEKVIEICGFEIQKDKLRIPSTKRTCFLGTNRNYKETEMAIVIAKINEFIANRSKIEIKFTPRNHIEPVVNCTQLDKHFINEVVNTIATELLNCDEKIINEPKSWKTGGIRSLPVLAESLGKIKLSQLKSQCGGLQTLLKNNGHIFQVSNGFVSLRNYAQPIARKSRKSKNQQNINIKRRLCWFHVNHPNGCILTSEMCTFRH